MPRLLFIDDDKEILEINKKYFTGRGFSVYTASGAREGLALAARQSPDCILLDVMMPDRDGFELCRQIRRFTDTPVIFLTAKAMEQDKVNGLLLGADDYIVKPYSLKELEARVIANIRRHGTASLKNGRLEFFSLVIDIRAHKAFYRGVKRLEADEEIALSNREFELLVLLAQNSGRDMSFEEIGRSMLGSFSPEDRRLVMVNVSRLRKKLEQYKGLENLIETVWSVGYRFAGKERQI